MPPSTIRFPRRPAPLALLTAIAALGCGGKFPVPQPSPAPAASPAFDPCALGDEPGAGRDTLTVAAADTARLLYWQRFDTLIRLDCNGEVRPGLAQSWSADSTGFAWTFVLREDAGAVAAQWQAGAADALRAAGVRSVVPLDARRLVVTLSAAHRLVPEPFADPSLAVGRTDPAARAIAMVASGGRDPRDALDRGADLVLTDDPAVLEYAGSRPDFSTWALPWSRTYVLVLPHERSDLGTVPDSAAFRAALARDAVRAPARGASAPIRWSDTLDCPASPNGSAWSPGGADQTIA
jgi:hypothetical protein